MLSRGCRIRPAVTKGAGTRMQDQSCCHTSCTRTSASPCCNITLGFATAFVAAQHNTHSQYFLIFKRKKSWPTQVNLRLEEQNCPHSALA